MVTLNGAILIEKISKIALKSYYFPEFNFVTQNKGIILSQISAI